MAKKCLPGVICIENMTLVIILILLIIIGYMYYVYITKSIQKPSSNLVVLSAPTPPPITLNGISTRTDTIRTDTMSDPYNPPLRNDGYYFPRDSADVRGIPINIKTRGTGMDYTQLGILTRPNVRNAHNGEMILPLMGRRLMNGRDKWQYYTISNTGNMNTKLPVSLKGKSCTGEYGCDEINNNDTVYVEGYKDTFVATVYENSTFSYIPYI
jgi:hypothetical protein